MARHYGSELVTAGFYWSRATWGIVTIPRKGGILPGGVEIRYYRIPLPLMLVLGPFLGGLYVIFLPFIGFAMVLSFLATKTGKAVRWAAYSLLDVAIPSWRPGEAYFAGQRRTHREGKLPEKDHGHPVKAEPEGRLAALEKEIEARRKKEKGSV